jgi:dipicolinate synthase subunit A
MNFTLQGSDPRFLYLKKRLEADGHSLTAEGGLVIAPPSQRVGVPYYADEVYALENAALTAEGTIELLMRRSNREIMGMAVLVVGYGRIGQALALRLRGLGAHVTVAARRPSARAAARTQGCQAVAMENIGGAYEAVLNTVPAPVLAGDYGGALCIDLASAPGGWPLGSAVLKAPGLPGLYAPKAAADVMAEAVYRVLEGNEHG